MSRRNWIEVGEAVSAEHRPRVYIAGPMTGHRNYNFEEFFSAEARLLAYGMDPVNPARHDIEEGGVIVDLDEVGGILRAYAREEGPFDWNKALDWDLKQIASCDAL
jgi:hypothetical protein